MFVQLFVAIFMLLPLPQAQVETIIDATQGDDLVVVNMERSTVAINGNIIPFPTDGSDVRVRGLGGNDRVVFRADPDVREAAVLTTRSIIMQSGPIRVITAGFETIDLRADVTDSVVINGSTDDDNLIIGDQTVTLNCDQCSVTTTEVQSFEFVGSQGGQDSVTIEQGVVDRLVARTEDITLSADQRIWRLSGVENLNSVDIDEFTFFDSPDDDRLVLERTRLTWVTPVLEISQVGPYQRVVADSDRFGRSGDDEAVLRMSELDETEARLVGRGDRLRDTTLIFSDVEKRITLTNFEIMNIDMLPGPSSGISRLSIGETESSAMTVNAEQKVADWGLRFPLPSDLNTTGFDLVESSSRPIEWTGTPGSDELHYASGVFGSTTTVDLISSDFTLRYQDDVSRFTVPISADPAGGHDTAIFLHGGAVPQSSSIAASQDELNFGLSANPVDLLEITDFHEFEETSSVNLNGEEGAFLAIRANETTGPVRLVVSPTSVAFSGNGFDHRFFNFPEVHVQTFPVCRRGVIRDYGAGEIDVTYNARGDSSLNILEDVIGFRCSGTTSGSIRGNMFNTNQSSVFFYESSLLLPPAGTTFIDGTRSILLQSQGIETIRVINAAAP